MWPKDEYLLITLSMSRKQSALWCIIEALGHFCFLNASSPLSSAEVKNVHVFFRLNLQSLVFKIVDKKKHKKLSTRPLIISSIVLNVQLIYVKRICTKLIRDKFGVGS